MMVVMMAAVLGSAVRAAAVRTARCGSAVRQVASHGPRDGLASAGAGRRAPRAQRQQQAQQQQAQRAGHGPQQGPAPGAAERLAGSATAALAPDRQGAAGPKVVTALLLAQRTPAAVVGTLVGHGEVPAGVLAAALRAVARTGRVPPREAAWLPGADEWDATMRRVCAAAEQLDGDGVASVLDGIAAVCFNAQAFVERGAARPAPSGATQSAVAAAVAAGRTQLQQGRMTGEAQAQVLRTLATAVPMGAAAETLLQEVATSVAQGIDVGERGGVAVLRAAGARPDVVGPQAAARAVAQVTAGLERASAAGAGAASEALAGMVQSALLRLSREAQEAVWPGVPALFAALDRRVRSPVELHHLASRAALGVPVPAAQHQAYARAFAEGGGGKQVSLYHVVGAALALPIAAEVVVRDMRAALGEAAQRRHSSGGTEGDGGGFRAHRATFAAVRFLLAVALRGESASARHLAAEQDLAQTVWPAAALQVQGAGDADVATAAQLLGKLGVLAGARMGEVGLLSGRAHRGAAEAVRAELESERLYRGLTMRELWLARMRMRGSSEGSVAGVALKEVQERVAGEWARRMEGGSVVNMPPLALAEYKAFVASLPAGEVQLRTFFADASEEARAFAAACAGADRTAAPAPGSAHVFVLGRRPE
eukprot:TRINITY_DN1363_c0_g1_i12.p3 TRINITY_DN1363_c0_g1~~TRINITY_DN1363_c0_g1_i12.p3  ORF type:complete len:654 (-),score=153.04 TRINITY_DN1363_c0_g1_i12:23-1984(-)